MPDALPDFIASRRAAFYSPATITYYDRTLRNFNNWLGIRLLDNSAIRQFFLHKRDQGVGPNGCHAYLRAIRAYANFLEDEDLLERPLDLPNIKREGMQRPCPTAKEVQAHFVAAKRGRDRLLICLLATRASASRRPRRSAGRT